MFAWGCGEMDWIVLAWFLTVLICLANALLFCLRPVHLPPLFPVWSISLTQEMWCGYISHLCYRIKAALLFLPFGEARKGGQALHKKVRSAGALSISGVACLSWRKMDLGWETKPQKHLLNNLQQVTKAAMIREKRSFLEAKCSSPGNTDFSLHTSSSDLLSQTGQSSERTCFISSQIGNRPPCHFYLK